MVLGVEGVKVFCFGNTNYIILIRSYAIYYLTAVAIKIAVWIIIRSCFCIRVNFFFLLTALVGSGFLILMPGKWTGLSMMNNHMSRCRNYLSLLNCIRTISLSLFLKLHPRKLGPWFVLRSFFIFGLTFIFINLPHCFPWNNAIVHGLVFPIALFTSWISYSSRFVGKLAHTWCFSWTLGSLSKYNRPDSPL